MLAMLLSNFMSLLANDKYDTSLRGIEWKSDTIKVAIPIELLRKANIKMIERKYFKKIIIEQDSIITLKDKYILEQENVINDFQKRLLVNATSSSQYPFTYASCIGVSYSSKRIITFFL